MQAKKNEEFSELLDLGKSIRMGYAKDQQAQDKEFLRKHDLVEDDGLLYHDNAVFVPDVQNLRHNVVDLMHSPPYCGHIGGNRTYQNLQQVFWWPGMKDSALDFVKHCELCQRDKASNKKPVGLLNPLPVPERIWDSVSMDFITQLPLTKSGWDAIMVFVDRLSKMVHFAPLKTTSTAEDVAKIFRHEIFRLHGIPREIMSDRDSKFTSHFWQEVCKSLGISQGMSTAFHPQTDGQTERVNRVLEDMLRHYVNPMLDDWDDKLDAVEFAVNNAWQESIRTSPFMLYYGRRPNTPEQAVLQTKAPAAYRFSHDWQLTASQVKMLLKGAEQRYDAGERRAQEAQDALHKAKENMTRAQARQKHNADKKREPEAVIEVGQQVLLSTRNIQLKHPGSRKLLPLWIGPFKVLEQVGKVAYKLNLPENMRIHSVFHVSLLKQFDANGTRIPPPPSLFEDGLEYEVDQVLDYDAKRKKYPIKWQGYGHEHNTWEPEKHVKNAPEKVQEYWDVAKLKDELRARHKTQSQEKASSPPAQGTRQSLPRQAKHKIAYKPWKGRGWWTVFCFCKCMSLLTRNDWYKRARICLLAYYSQYSTS